MERFKLNKEAVQRWIGAVESDFDLNPGDLVSTRRHREIVDVRHLCYYLMRKHNMTTVYIGKLFKRDHSSIIHGSEKVAEYLLPFNQLPDAKINRLDNYLGFLVKQQRTQALKEKYAKAQIFGS
jgi:chromosomal replication initiation ATPase DnaA